LFKKQKKSGKNGLKSFMNSSSALTLFQLDACCTGQVLEQK